MSQSHHQCRVCAQIKPRWIKPSVAHVIKSTSPWQRLSLDFMTNKPTSPEGFCNVLTIIDKYSRFPFAFSTKDRSSRTVINCLKSLYTLFGPPVSIHSDGGPEFFYTELSSQYNNWRNASQTFLCFSKILLSSTKLSNSVGQLCLAPSPCSPQK